MPATTPLPAVQRPTEGFRSVLLPSTPHRPVRVFLPDDYQAKYAYPLVVLFHAEGESEEQTARLVPQLSRRNYIALCLRGSVKRGLRPDGRPAFGWGDTVADRGVREALAYVHTQHRVHADRVFLMGIGEGVTAAFQLGMSMCDRPAGIVALNGSLPSVNESANDLRILIGHGIANPVTPIATTRRAATALRRVGATVRMNRYATSHRIHPDMLRDANLWIMSKFSK